MKGITPIVATILLLLITISMVGFAFVWFNRVGQLTTEQTQQQLQNQLSQQAQKIRIDAATTTVAAIRNIGTSSIPLAQITLFINSASRQCSPWVPAIDLAPGATATCTWTGAACVAGTDIIKVTAPGGSDSIKC